MKTTETKQTAEHGTKYSEKERAAQLLEREGFQNYEADCYELGYEVCRYDVAKAVINGKQTTLFVELDDDSWIIRVDLYFPEKIMYYRPHLFRVFLMRFLSQVADENRRNRKRAKLETYDRYDIQNMGMDVEIDDLDYYVAWINFDPAEERELRADLRDEYGATIPLSFEFFSDPDGEDGIEIYASAACDKMVYVGMTTRTCLDLSYALADHIEEEMGIEEVDRPWLWVEFNHAYNEIVFAFIVPRE